MFIVRYTPVIGLEIHAELGTKSKIFCSCENAFGGKENTRCCPVCMGYPGTLPVLNRRVVDFAVMAGCMFDCRIEKFSSFERKNYFYPDLPKGYQITQKQNPICVNGMVNGIRIKQIHIEEDAGKLIHEAGVSRIDHNRCGVPLIEIVTEPDIHDAQTAKDFVKEIAGRLKYAEICDARMEEGSLRCDVNVSLEKDGVSGARTEIKNINSFRAVERAIEYEIKRQSKLLDEGRCVVAETRRFDSEKGVTKALRTKEEMSDYRYFPEPDIMPVILTDEYIEKLKNTLPEFAYQRKERYVGYGLSEEEVNILISNKEISDLYDSAVAEYSDYKRICTLISVELLRLKGNGVDISRVTGEMIAELVKISNCGTVSRNDAKKLLEILCKEGGNVAETAYRYGFIMSCDEGETEEVVQKIIAENPKAVGEYLEGSEKVIGFLMGQCVRCIGKGANPSLIKEKLLKLIEK